MKFSPASDDAKKGWVVRPYQAGDEKQIVRLFKTCFSKTMSLEDWHWKYCGADQSAVSSWVAETDGRIIGHYGGIAVPFWHAGLKTRAMVCVDVMVHPDFQGRWVLINMGRNAHKAWRRSGVAIWLGLPNDKWGKGHKKRLRIHDVFPLQWQIRPLRVEAQLARRYKLPLLNSLSPLGSLWNMFWAKRLQTDPSVELIPATTVGAEFDQLWRRAKNYVSTSIQRDSAWLQWRYLMSPQNDYRILIAKRAGKLIGYIVVNINSATDKRATITELFVNPVESSAFPTMILRCLEYLHIEKVQSVAVLAIPDTATAKNLARAGFVVIRKGRFEVGLAPLALEDISPLKSPHVWSLAGGDFDVV